MEQLAPHAAFAFAVALPDAFYVQGLALDAPQVLAELASQHGLDQKTFVEFWESTPARLGTQAAFAGARAQGINSYPTLIYRRGAMRSLVARGFLPPREALARLEDLRSGRDA